MPTDFNIPKGLAIIVSGYLKRIIEGQYDKLSDIPAFEKLKRQPPTVKYGIEASLYALTAFLEQNIGEDTFIKKTLKEVGLDFGSEFSKRLINGDQLKAVVKNNQDDFKKNAKDDFISILSDLSDEDILEFLNWIESTTPEERKNVIRNISKLSEEDILKVWRFTPETRQKLLKFSVKPSNKNGFWDTVMEPLNKRLDTYIQTNKKR